MKFPEADFQGACPPETTLPKVNRRFERAVFTHDSTGFGITEVEGEWVRQADLTKMSVFIAVSV
ncbi:MAG TPA: hypothetical protein DEB39_13825 [Planctomycetaceae bacterium]|nr:hypothetical protein [Planctomycetaceae bacterium]